MNLYFSPMACSLATRIALYEAGARSEFTQVDTKAKRTIDGSDFLTIAPMGQVPVLHTDDGMLLTENTAVLQYVADRFPHAELAPPSGPERARLQQWLGFIGTELHKAIFIALLDPRAPEGAKTYAREKIPLRFGVLERHLTDHDFLLDRFSVADAYLAAILNWAPFVGLDLAQWSAVQEYHKRLLKRPSIEKAVGEEWRMYQEEQRQRQLAKISSGGAMTKPAYTTIARVKGGRAGGQGRITSGELELQLQLPKELGGPGGAPNPEQLFAIGYAACFESVLSILGQRMKITADDAVIDSTVALIPIENGRFKLSVALDISLPSIGNAQQAADLVRMADQICPYSNAVRGNIEVALAVNGAPLGDQKVPAQAS